MDTKEVVTRLEIIKLATTIGDHSTIVIQTDKLKSANSSRLNEISSLLNSKNYRQGLYLIKGYLSDMGGVDTFDNFDVDSEGERVLDIEDMLRMSPLAKETIKDYKRSVYTSDDLEAFAKKIEVSSNSEEIEMDNSFDNKKSKLEVEKRSDIPKNNTIEDSSKNEDSTFVDSIEEEVKEPKELKTEEKYEPTQEDIQKGKEITKALESADSETPLDEISAEVMGSTTEKNRAKVLSKYKTLRAKFAKKDSNCNVNEKSLNNDKEALVDIKKESIKKDSLKENAQDNIDSKSKDVVSSVDNNINESLEIKDESKGFFNSEDTQVAKDSSFKKTTLKEKEPKSKLSKEEQIAQDKKDRETIYTAIPNIEEKFRQAFVLYPPLKESEVWTEEVVRFLKGIKNNSFTEMDIKQLLDDYNYYLDKKDLAKASQILLLASATDSKYAKFLLARELFTAKVLKRDLKKSFALMKELANSFYPEAICDLGQFYEYGIGVTKDKKVAIKLYEKAFELGVSRATKHINRLKESSGILSTIFKLK